MPRTTKYTTEHLDLIFACARKSVPRTKYGQIEAAKDAGCDTQTMSAAKLILTEATNAEIKRVLAGEISMHSLARLLRRGLTDDQRTQFFTSAKETRFEKVRENAALYRDLKEALLKLTGLPRAKDVVHAVKNVTQRNDDVERCLSPAIKWLKEFEHEFARKAA